MGRPERDPVNKDNASAISGAVPTLPTSAPGYASAWATDALYFAAAISDDVLVGNNSTQIWGDDVIELAIRVLQTNQTHQFTLALDGRRTDNGNPISSLTFVTRTIAGGWALEVMVPPSALGLTSFAADQQYPFTFALWDDDLFTYPGQTHMFWRSDDSYTYKPDWGILKLSSTFYNFPPSATTMLTAGMIPPVSDYRREAP